MPVLGVDSLILPSYADVAGAYAEIVPIVNPPATQSATHVVDASYFEVIVSVQCGLLTSAAAGNRELDLQYKDSDQNTFAFIPPNGFQAPNSQLNWQWLLNFGNALGSSSANHLGPCAPVVLHPGYSLTIFLNGPQIGDQLSNVFLYVQRFPTGTPASALYPPAAPTLS